MNETFTYYTEKARDFAESTRQVDMSDIHRRFLSRIPPGARILDVGCGSGRDSRAFADLGYRTCAIDAVPAMCEAAREFCGVEAECLSVLDLDRKDEFDGVWACASLLHLKMEELPEAFYRIRLALKIGGFFYVSFKLGVFSGIRNGRYFTDMNEEVLRSLAEEAGGLQIEEVFITSDARKGREAELWLNALLSRTN